MEDNKSYNDFVKRMGSFDMELSTDDIVTPEKLQHHGVKGMKWGVTKSRVRSAVTNYKEKKASSAPKEKSVSTLASKRREQNWKKEYKNREKLTTDELKEKVERLRLETEFNRLSNVVGDNRIKKVKATHQFFKDVPIKRADGSYTPLQAAVIGKVGEIMVNQVTKRKGGG